MFALDHITLHGTQRPRLDDVTVTISAGRTAIVGYSGAGKTSLLNVLAGFEIPDAGTVRRLGGGTDQGMGKTGSEEPRVRAATDPPCEETEYNVPRLLRGQRSHDGWPGLEGARPKPRGFLRSAQSSPGHPIHRESIDRALPLFWVPQNGGLWPHLTVEQHLMYVQSSGETGRNGGGRSDSGRSLDSSDEILATLDLEGRRSAFPAELSQGERSRLALARALASRATVLLLDEPFSHVDPVRKPDYWKAVQRWTSQEMITMVFSSHEPETVLRQADRVVCLHEGRVVFQGATSALYDSPPSRELGEFLGPLNWFESDAAEVFLNRSNRSGGCVAVRPERLMLTADASSPIEFVSSPFRGGYAESLVKHVPSGTIRTVLHQAFGDVPKPGERIALNVAGKSGIGEQIPPSAC